MKTLSNTLKINKSNLMKRAWANFKAGKFQTFGEALKASWLTEKSNVVTYNINTLHKKYSNELVNYVTFKLNGNAFDAQDIVSEVFVKVNQNIYLFDSSKSSLKTWLYNITKNCMLDYIRAKKASKRNTEKTSYISDYQKDNGENVIEIANTESTNQLENSELSNAIAIAMQTLKPIEQKLIQMAEIEGFKYQEIANELNIPLNTVKVYILRAKAKLATQLKQTYELYLQA